ncbi:glycogen/starch/alpha-glucan phosphorylase [Maridesulfovibrio hydrothermalis]|uniref:Alpha-1,4 glucan phosphorylase n=1 Tax=Maridesulfovibrio hydrothermalis AM13 = DSM 14728 TaxID=1121451 RepID=L0RAU6_9BACT|nr:glycogen/starch/alpha-glucan phosphorylase [Maridesulfovibrio hydrothermalis]CCO22696.1 glycogen phosphorylase [Maridesulfovibrio hydrothermalis AM13 = DSM 14728]
MAKMDSNELLEEMGGMDVEALTHSICRHHLSNLGRDYGRSDLFSLYQALAYTLRDRLVRNWVKTQRSYYNQNAKSVYYLSLEFLAGKSLSSNALCLGVEKAAEEALAKFGVTMEEAESAEADAGLGNGGLGRLASCFLDSMATLGIPGYGYGIRYEYGIFKQAIENGEQVELPDDWLHFGNPWEFCRRGFMFTVHLYGREEKYTHDDGSEKHRWTDTAKVMAMPVDMLIPGYKNGNVINMRLWEAQPARRFNLDLFNSGDYIRSMEDAVRSETISKVLYPSDRLTEGRELRLVQQYFFVSATIQDMMRRFKKLKLDFSELPNRAVVQLNETHPAIAIPELMRILIDEHMLNWDESWRICRRTFAYTNHTVMPEALETWPLDMMSKVLPRHVSIIFEINRRFMEEVKSRFPGDEDRLKRMSIIEDCEHPQVRMAWLAVLGSFTVNGVSALHGELIKKNIFQDFVEMFPGRFTSVTNGITPRRWLKQCNPGLSDLITEKIGPEWVTDLSKLKKLEPLADDAEFQNSWYNCKLQEKKRLVEYARKEYGIYLPTDWLYDVQVKRIHEYKRQVLNILHAITLYCRLKNDPNSVAVARLKIFGGKAAPGYFLAKRIIRLINSVGAVVNSDPTVNHKLRIAFLPNYRVSQAERIIPATDLSEQISLAGTEASGTGNMKFALNGALTVGTLDGANIEIMEEAGRENMFIFGMDAEEVERRKYNGYNPSEIASADKELAEALHYIGDGTFSEGDRELFQPILDSLFANGDQYMVLADYRAYVDVQDEVDKRWLDRKSWLRSSILNTAGSGKFSSDRAILDYANSIWGVRPMGKE